MKYVTILTVNYINELMVVQSLLEAEGIEYFIKDEYTVQTDPFLSNVVGGIKLQVKESDVEKAAEILKELGCFKENDTPAPEKSSKLIEFTEKIPFINKMSLEWRLIILVGIILVLIIGIIVIASFPSTHDRLTDGTWCLNSITHNGKEITANTQELKVIMNGSCCESMKFLASGEIMLPGFDSRKVVGSWAVNENRLIISHVDTFDLIYNHTYTIKFRGADLLLKSENTTFDCSKEILHYHLF